MQRARPGVLLAVSSVFYVFSYFFTVLLCWFVGMPGVLERPFVSSQ